MKTAGPRHSVSRGYTTRFVLISSIFIGIQIAVLALGWVAVRVINTTRAYAMGESFYSKGQNAAVLNLYKYAQSGDEKYFDAFRRSIDVPLGDRKVREALDRADPDPAAAAAGLLQARTNPDDIPDVIKVFLWFRHWGPFERAVEDWRVGDELIGRLLTNAAELHRLGQSGALHGPVRDHMIEEMDELSAELAKFEDSFSERIGDTARAATHLVVSVLGFSSIALWSLGVGFAWRTYRKGINADLQLQASEARFRDFAEIASDWFWETDTKHRVSYLSERFAEATGAVPADFLGKTAFEAGLRIVDGEAMTPQSEAFEIRGPFRKLRYKYTSHGEEQYWAISGSPVFDASGRFAGYRGTGSNVSAEIRSQQALLEAKTTSELASRAKSEFLANMSHELRTPLNAIIGFSEVIKDRLFGAALDRYVDYARDIFNSGTHLLAIINDILDLSKIEAGQTELYEEEIEIEGVTESVVQVLRQKIDAGKLTLKLDLPAGLPTIFADERKLKQILMNLLSNAVKFTPAGGRVTVSVSLDDAGNLRLVVTDTGIGMAPEEIPRALAAFVQIDSSLSRRHEGTGLGLPLAKALAELHGGQLDLISTPGRGTSVIVTLPRSRLRLAAAE